MITTNIIIHMQMQMQGPITRKPNQILLKRKRRGTNVRVASLLKFQIKTPKVEQC